MIGKFEIADKISQAYHLYVPKIIMKKIIILLQIKLLDT